MRAAGLPDAAIASFCYHLERYLFAGDSALRRDQIEPVPGLADAESLDGLADTGIAALDRAVVIKLNGGLGTSMGLERAKSLLPVRGGLSFLDLIARQILALRAQTGAPVPLLMMNSFRTDQDTRRVLDRYPDLAVDGLPVGFLQHRIPKVPADGEGPADWPDDPELEWCPPGHGDLYLALDTSGILDRLLDLDYEFAFVSNSDNLGAILEPAILGHVIEHRLAFLLEASDRTPADRKGGHLCRLSDGRLALRESAQCPPDEEADFQDVTRYRYFNTNNIWVHLPSLRRVLDCHGGILPLHTIVNRKTIDPRNPSSRAVIQLETAMGAAISVLEPGGAIRVSRRRFSPVKNTNDLLAVRSDAYRLTPDSRVVLIEARTAPTMVSLDDRFYTLIDDFDRRFPFGPPSLAGCDSLTVEGDVTFGRDVVLHGDVRVVAEDGSATVEAGAVIGGEVRL
jgi:UTP--glucose-1-phosphate uridylyltransferase